MAYKEPYPVTTTYPPSITGNGKRVCYHYTQSYSEVCTIFNNLRTTISKVENMSTISSKITVPAGIAGFYEGLKGAFSVTTKASPFISAATSIVTIGGFATETVRKSCLNDLKQKYSTYYSVKHFMEQHGFKRVTFSQVLEYRISKIAGDYLMGWYCVGGPRVPHISYYYKK